MVTSEKLEHIGSAISVFSLKWSDLPPDLLQAIQVASAVLDIGQGKLPVVTGPIANIRLAPGELVHAIFQARLLDERVVRREFIGGNTGLTFRLTKGVNYRMGGTRGRSMPVSAIVPVDEGNVIVSSQRVMFMGRKKPFAYVWTDVICAEPAGDGVHLVFHGKNNTATLQYANSTYAEVLAALFAFYMR
jgi:hypothetical protein